MQALNPFFRPKNRPYRTETLFPIPCYNRAMMNSEVGIAPVAAVCHRRRTDPKNPTDCWSVATFGRKPQIEPVTPTFQSPRQSSLIKPNQAISCRGAIQSRSPSCSKIPTSPVLLRQTRSKPGASCNHHHALCAPARHLLPLLHILVEERAGERRLLWWLCQDAPLRRKQLDFVQDGSLEPLGDPV